MTSKQFFNSLANGQSDVLQQFLDLLSELKIRYCVIGGLAVNAYVEPVVSLDLELIVAADSISKLKREAEKKFTVKEFPHSLKLTHSESDLRIQVQTDPRYQAFTESAELKEVLGYPMRVASLGNVLQGKIWEYLDPERCASKRQKDLADIFRLVEAYSHLEEMLPASIKNKF